MKRAGQTRRRQFDMQSMSTGFACQRGCLVFVVLVTICFQVCRLPRTMVGIHPALWPVRIIILATRYDAGSSREQRGARARLLGFGTCLHWENFENLHCLFTGNYAISTVLFESLPVGRRYCRCYQARPATAVPAPGPRPGRAVARFVVCQQEQSTERSE